MFGSSCLSRNFTWYLRHKPVSHLGSIQKFVAVVVADYQRVKGIPSSVAADNKLLTSVDLVLDPRSGSFAGFQADRYKSGFFIKQN